MLSCRDVEGILQDYLDGYLLPSQREVLEGHVAACDSCRALLAGFARIDGRMEELGQVEVPAHLARSILDALPAQTYAPSPLRRALSWAVAPALILLLAASGFLLRGRYLIKDLEDAREVEVIYSAPAALSVVVVGDFNGWNPKSNPMIRSTHQGLWRTRLRLPRGIYQYSFVVDGTTWAKDPQAKKYLADGFGGENSVIIVDG